MEYWSLAICLTQFVCTTHYFLNTSYILYIHLFSRLEMSLRDSLGYTRGSDTPIVLPGILREYRNLDFRFVQVILIPWYKRIFRFILTHPCSSIFVYTHPYSSIFIHSHTYSSILIHTHPYSSILIHTHPYSFILIHTHSYSFLLIHTHPY